MFHKYKGVLHKHQGVFHKRKVVFHKHQGVFHKRKVVFQKYKGQNKNENVQTPFGLIYLGIFFKMEF